jgi:hypothetical protein
MQKDKQTLHIFSHTWKWKGMIREEEKDRWKVEGDKKG